MNDQDASPKQVGKLRKVLLTLVGAAGVILVVGVGVWTVRCPCHSTPGFVLLGERSDEAISDWSFANDVPLCQVQMQMGLRPHSINLNCMAAPDGELFLSCSVGEQKYWCPRVGEDEPAKLRLSGVVYPVVLNRVLDEATLDKSWAARIAKLQKPEVIAVQPGGRGPAADAERPGHWWTFHVRSAGD